MVLTTRDFNDRSNFNNEEIEFKTFIDFLKRNLLIYSISLIIIPTSVFLIKKQAKPIYSSSVDILTEANTIKSFINKNYQIGQPTNNLINIMQSSELLNPIFNYVKDIKSDNNLKFEDWIDSHLSITRISDTNILKIVYKDYSVNQTKKVMELLLDSYRNYFQSEKIKSYEDLQSIFKLTIALEEKYKKRGSRYIDLKGILKSISKEEDWKIINGPEIKEIKSSISNKFIFIFTFVYSIFIFSILYFKEKFSGIIYDKDFIKENLNSVYLGRLFLKDKSLSKKLIEKYLGQEIFNLKLGIINLDSLFLKNKPILINFNKEIFKDHNNIDISNQLSIDNCKKIIILAKEGNCTLKNLKILNSYITILETKLVGFILIS